MATATRVDLADQVQGTLSTLNGGTGATSLAGASIEQTTNKNAANGYAGLNSSTLLTSGLLGSGTASASTVLMGGTTGAWTSLTRAIVPETVTTSSAGTLTLTTTNSAYVFTGTTATWTLPAVSGNTGRFLILESRGSGAITLNPAGADLIWLFGGTVTTYTIAAGGSLMVVNDGTYWNALSYDVANNAVGVLPIVNGGTGATIPGTRVTSITSSATPTISIGSTDLFEITALATAITSMAIAGPTLLDGQKLLVRIKDNGTARAITWGTPFIASGVAPLLSTTVVGQTHMSGFIYDSVKSKFVCMAVDAVGY